MLCGSQALSERAEGGSINLDDLESDSPLATMLTLEALRFKGGPLDKVRDSLVPAVGRCAFLMHVMGAGRCQARQERAPWRNA